MGIEGLYVSFNADASPNGAAGFKAWLEGMIAFHLPNMDVVITDAPQTFVGVAPATATLERLADQMWKQNKTRSSGKIYAIKELRLHANIGLKEAKDAIDAAERRNP